MLSEYLDAIPPALAAVIAYVLAGAKNADRATVPGAARAAIVRWLDRLSQKSEHWRVRAKNLSVIVSAGQRQNLTNTSAGPTWIRTARFAQFGNRTAATG